MQQQAGKVCGDAERAPSRRHVLGTWAVSRHTLGLKSGAVSKILILLDAILEVLKAAETKVEATDTNTRVDILAHHMWEIISDERFCYTGCTKPDTSVFLSASNSLRDHKRTLLSSEAIQSVVLIKWQKSWCRNMASRAETSQPGPEGEGSWWGSWNLWSQLAGEKQQM